MSDTASAPDAVSTEEISELIQRTLENHGTMKQIRGLTDTHMATVYALAYNLYQQERYQESHDLFTFLCLYDHLEKKYWIGLAACRQLLKRYAAAIDAFSMAAMLDVENPELPLHAAECHLALGNLEGAESGAFAARHWSEGRTGFDALRDRAALLLERVGKAKAEATTKS